MDQNHKIPVNFARSVSHKVNVEVDKLIDYELTTINNSHYRAHGAIRSDTVISVSATLGVLLIIVLVVMLVFNG